MMPPLYRLLSLRYLWHRWDRAVLIIASIALGVATLVSSRILNNVIETAAAQTTTPLKGAADLFISNGELGVPRAVAEDLRKAAIPGVKAVQPLLFERITLPDLGDRSAVLVGVDLVGGPAVAGDMLKIDVTLFEGLSEKAGLAMGQRVLVNKSIHDAAKALKPGEHPQVTVRLGSRRVVYKIGGYFEYQPGSPAAALGNNVVGLELSAAARFVYPGDTPRVNRVDLFVEPGVEPASVMDAIRKIVGDRAEVTTPETQGQSTQEIVGGLKTGFTLCSLGAMVVGLFLVYNALSVTVAERRHDIGVLRSVGATRWQIVCLFTAAAIVLGIIGAALGVPLGIGLAKYALSEFREVMESIFLNPETDAGLPDAATVVLAMAAGIATAVFAALVPAIQAASDEPADAVRRSGRGAHGIWRLLHFATCGAMIFGGLGMILARHSLPHRLGSFGGMMIGLVGLLLAAPILVTLLVRLVQPVLRRVLPIEARLAADNLTRAPGRTGVVIGALAAGVAVMIQTAGVGQSNEEPIREWLDRMLKADVYVFGGNMASGTSSQAPMEPRVVAELAAKPGIGRTTGLRFARPNYNGTLIYLLAVDAERFGEMLNERGSPHLLPKYRQVKGNRVVVSENFSLRHKIKPGDTVTLTGATGPVTLEVVDTVVDYSWSRGTIIIDRPAYARLFGDPQIDLMHVFFAPGLEDLGHRSVVEYASDTGLFVVERETTKSFLAGLIDRVYKLAYLQQLIVGIVAALGVVTALLISVLQRKRELGLLLAVGATPSQVIRSVLWEAILMGAFGTVLGIAIGVPLEWYVVKVILVEESGFNFAVIFPWKQALGIAAGAITLATLAGLLPAIHAVRTRIPEAIAYE